MIDATKLVDGERYYIRFVPQQPYIHATYEAGIACFLSTCDEQLYPALHVTAAIPIPLPEELEKMHKQLAHFPAMLAALQRAANVLGKANGNLIAEGLLPYDEAEHHIKQALAAAEVCE